MLYFQIYSLFPDAFPGSLNCSILKKSKGRAWDMEVIPMRNDEQKGFIDDTPYGGGAGMVMRAECISKAIQNSKSVDKIICMSAKGLRLSQQYLYDLTNYSSIGIVCGRYEGIDQRVIEKYQMDEVSIGDFVLCGGEVAAALLIEATIRLLPNVVQNSESLTHESYADFLLEYPQYTKPYSWEGYTVPDVLLSGNHKLIDHYQYTKSAYDTMKKRPDLWAKYVQKMLQHSR